MHSGLKIGLVLISIFLVWSGPELYDIYRHSDPREFLPPADSWYREPPASFGAKIGVQSSLPKSDVCVVAADRQAQAIALLQNVAIVSLNTENAALFCGHNIGRHNGLAPYLVRGVFLNEATGSYDVLPFSKTILVAHGCLGDRPVKMKRQALVVFLPWKPQQVYVTCDMAE